MVPEAERAEREAKARLIAEGTRLGGIDAMLPARGDFAFGLPFLTDVASAWELPYVLSNVSCSTPLPWPTVRRFDKAGARVEVYGIAHPDLNLAGCTVLDAGQALEGVPVSDTVVIVLADLGRTPEAEIAARAPGVDFFLRADSTDTLTTPETLATGALVLSSGARGKLLGVANVKVTPGARAWTDAGASAARAADVDAATSHLTELAARKAKATETREVSRLTRQEEFWAKKQAAARTALEVATATTGPTNLLTNTLRGLGDDVGEHAPTMAKVAAVKATLTGSASAPREAATAGAATGIGAWVGSAACTPCHAAQAAQWSHSGHARAYASIVADERQFDRDCYACHVTGAVDGSGPTDPRALHGLENVGCESCHGAGQAHVASPTSAHLVRQPPTSQCVRCHDSRQDGGRFDELTYRPKVAH
ncbi:MAG: hypothetical protein EXR71_13160 [Myxococcales bacterium]|nr:hypothetical protein [Myxococcales bacterium]